MEMSTGELTAYLELRRVFSAADRSWRDTEALWVGEIHVRMGQSPEDHYPPRKSQKKSATKQQEEQPKRDEETLGNISVRLR